MSTESMVQAQRAILYRCGDGIAQALNGADREIAAHALRVIRASIAQALNGADREIAAHALRMLRASLDVLADCDSVGPETHDTIRHADDILSVAEFQIEAQGAIPLVRSINSGLSEAATCLLGMGNCAQPEKVRHVEIGTGPSVITARRVG